MKLKHLVLVLLITPYFTFGQIQKEWLGHYSGDLTIVGWNGQTSSFHMEVIFIQETDSSYQWTLVYGEDSTRQERNYTLKRTSRGEYEIDENNGIVLSNNLFGNKFISVFKVQTYFLHTTYAFEKNQLIFSLTSSTAEYQTGDDPEADIPEEEKFTVYALHTTVYQYASLKKIKKK